MTTFLIHCGCLTHALLLRGERRDATLRDKHDGSQTANNLTKQIEIVKDDERIGQRLRGVDHISNALTSLVGG